MVHGPCDKLGRRAPMHDEDLISLSQTVNNVAPSGVYLSAVAAEAEASHANGSLPLYTRRSKTFQVGSGGVFRHSSGLHGAGKALLSSSLGSGLGSWAPQRVGAARALSGRIRHQ